MNSSAGKWIVVALIGALLLTAGGSQLRSRRTPVEEVGPNVASAETAAQADEAKRQQVAEGNGVAAFVILEKDGTFSIYFETHSGDMSAYSAADKATLTSDKGPVKGSLSWREDKNSSGHHRYGTLAAPDAMAVLSDPTTKWVQLELRDLAGVPSRILRWDNPAALLGESTR